MAEKILTELKKRVSELTLIPSGGGRYEVTVDGKLVFSKLKEGRFPEYSEIKSKIVKK